MLGSEWWLDNAYRLKALDIRFFAAFKESENLMIQDRKIFPRWKNALFNSYLSVRFC